MSKIFRFVLVAALAAMLFTPSVNAQDKQTGVRDLWPTYYTIDTNCLKIKPGDDTCWHNTYPLTINPGEEVWFGTRNLYIPVNTKNWWLKLEGATVFSLTGIEVRAYIDSDTQTDTVSVIGKSSIVNGVIFSVLIKPQPDWEVLLVKNNTDAPIQIDNAIGESHCSRVDFQMPALTNWGLIVLLVLLVLAGIIVIRQRRRSAVRA